MKHILWSFLFLGVTAQAVEIKVSKMRVEHEMERSFSLHTNYAEKVTLDCQSFVQGLYLGPRSNGNFKMLDPQECQELYERIEQSLQNRQKHCLDVDAEIRSDYPCS